MMKWEINDGFYKENKDYICAFIVVVVLCLAGAWYVYDSHRNEPVYEDTDATVAELEDRIKSLESRI